MFTSFSWSVACYVTVVWVQQLQGWVAPQATQGFVVFHHYSCFNGVFFLIPFLWATCLWNYIMYSCLITDLSTLSLSSLPNIVCRFQSFRLQTSPLQLNVISISLPLWLQFPLPNWIEFPLFHNFLSYSPSFMFATFFAQNITSHEHTPTHVFFQIVFLDFSSNHSQIRRTPLHQMGCVPCF